jgi:DNA-3-methyladenine glycosylase I
VRQDGLRQGVDGLIRCAWAGDDPLYCDYHDREWGRPVRDDRRLYEKLCLEGFQSGLSWLTILKKRPAFRRAFADFDYEEVSRFGPTDVQRLLTDASIVRHRGKIEAAIHNAARAVELEKEHGSLARYFWSFVPPPSERPKRLTWTALKKMSTTPTSIRLSKDLKRRGFRFVGPTTAYAFMQAMGIVNDHVEGCGLREEVERARAC